MLTLLSPRADAIAYLVNLLDTIAGGEHDAEVAAWVTDRSEDVGGFLWLAGLLGSRPTAMAAVIRELLGKPQRRRSGLRARLEALHATDACAH